MYEIESLTFSSEAIRYTGSRNEHIDSTVCAEDRADSFLYSHCVTDVLKVQDLL